MTEPSKKNPGVMSQAVAEARRAAALRTRARIAEDQAEKEAKKAKKKKTEGITGRDDYILSEALATAITVLSRLEHPPESNIKDMKEILADWYPTGGFQYLIEGAERRLDTLLPVA